MDISDPASYAKAYSELMNSEDSRCPGSWGLAAWGPGSRVESYGTHMAFCGIQIWLQLWKYSRKAPTKSCEVLF